MIGPSLSWDAGIPVLGLLIPGIFSLLAIIWAGGTASSE
ncbi:hypothetical protein AGRO_5078 [Agrobacterium sp. ATCC 31749]|nr:hypothetical protein AGRO_5078 [Agrobacterium sp. ATCC 31749]